MADEEESIDDILSGETTGAAEEPTEAEPQGAESEPAEEAETPKDETPKAEPPSAIDPDQFKGYLDEREKRQRLERENAELQSRLKADETKPDPVEDPEGFREEMHRYRDEVRQELRMERLEEQREDMREAHEDFDAAWEWGNEAIGQNPILAQQLQGARNIPRAVYKAYQDHLKLQRVGALEGLEQENADLKARLAALEAGKSPDPLPSKPSLATAGTSTNVAEEGEMSLEDIIGADFRSRPT